VGTAVIVSERLSRSPFTIGRHRNTRHVTRLRRQQPCDHVRDLPRASDAAHRHCVCELVAHFGTRRITISESMSTNEQANKAVEAMLAAGTGVSTNLKSYIESDSYQGGSDRG
jgi:hypothetical protein